jgi:hypothetical protein
MVHSSEEKTGKDEGVSSAVMIQRCSALIFASIMMKKILDQEGKNDQKVTEH